MTDLGLHALIALLLPALSFLVLALVAPLRRSGRAAAWFSILCIGGSLLAAAIAWNHGGSERVMWEWLPAHNGPMAMVGVQFDADSSIMLVLVALVAFLVQLYSTSYLGDEPRPSLGRYYTYQSLFAFSMMGLVLAPNLLQLFVCWELVGLCSYLLIGFWYQKPEAARAATKAFWVTKAGDVGLLIGIVLLWREAGTFDLVQLRELVERGALPVAGLSLITFCIYLGAVGKSAQFPLHVWLPDAMEGPTPVSALIHAATMVTAGVYLLVRTEWLFALTPDVLTIIAWIGALTALLAAVLACVQDDIKRVLAYSTVSQLGYMMTAIGAGFAAAGFFHLLTHGVFKALLFLGAGAVIHAVHSNNLPDMGGLARRMPQTAIVFVVGTLSLAGIPLFGGFLSKEEILGAVWAGGMPGPFVVLMVVALLTAFYMFRVVFLAFWGTPYSHAAGAVDGADHAHDPPVAMLLPLWILTLASVAIGIYFTFNSHPAEAGLDISNPAEAGLDISNPAEAGLHVEAPAWLMPAAVGVAIAGILLAWLTYQRRAIDPDRLAAAFGPIRRAALARFWIDDLLEGTYRIGLLGFSRIVGWIDRYVVDGVLNVASAWTLDAGDDMRSIQTGRAQDYVYAVAFGVLALIVWVQTLGSGIWDLGFGILAGGQ